MTFCSEYSHHSGEQLFATAKQVDHWLLLEHRGRWEKEAKDSLPATAQAAVEVLRTRFPKMRLALIRQHGRTSQPLTGYLALSRESGSRVIPFSFENHEALADLDFDRLSTSRASEQKLFLVCTHGTHDRCCAKFGNGLYEAMRREAGDDVWQTSHIGGCRFAPNVVSLPTGVVYGRVSENDCPDIVDAVRANRVLPKLMRGRSCYSKPVQAAEYFVRTERRESGDLSVESAMQRDSEWSVVFRRGKDRISVWMLEAETGILTYKSCSAVERSPRPGFRLIGCGVTNQEDTNPWHVRAFSKS